MTTMLEVSVAVSDPDWLTHAPDAEPVSRRSAEAAFQAARPSGLGGRRVETGVRLASDAEVRDLNRDYRDCDRATNVLSFPALGEDEIDRLPKDAPVLLGDVIIALGVSRREARAEAKPLTDHLSHLVVHGVLHLLGFDHEEERDAAAMELLETEVLAGLGIADPYADGGELPASGTGRP